jgi:putative transposase
LGVAPKANAHAVHDLKYHFVWIPKYRKQLLVGAVAKAMREILPKIAEAYGMEIDTMEVVENHVHIFLSAPPRYSPARIMQIFKSISARELFARFPWLKGKLWGGELWGDGYFVRSVGNQVTSEIIRRYIIYQHSPKYIQLELWEESS